MSRISVTSGRYLILEGFKNRMGRSQVVKVDGPIFVMDFLARNSRALNASLRRGVVMVENPLDRPEFGPYPPN
jgi:hypothetical protein